MILLSAALALLAGTAPALAAADAADIAADVDFRGYYIDPGAPVDINEMEALVDEFPGFGFVVLAEDPPAGADVVANEVLFGSSARTVIVVSPRELGYVSDDFDDGQLDAAADNAIDLFDRSYVEGFRRFATELTGAGDASSGGAGSGLLVFLLIVVAVIGFLIWRARKAGERRASAHAAKLEELKSEIRNELGTAANEILALEDRVRMSENDRAQELYAAGARGYAEFQEELEAARSFDEIHELGNKVDMVLWQLEAAEALIEGREIPPEPVPESLPAPEAPPAEPRRADLPPDLDLRRDRRPPLQPSGPGGGGFDSFGGLGAIAVILRELQRAGRPARTPFGSGRSRGGMQMPRFPGFGSGSGRRGPSGSSRRSSPRRSSGSSTSRSRGARSRPKGRGRRRR